jgi:hypothetical protein
MSKREINAIAGHELTHLKRSHPAKLSMAMLAACFAPLWLLGIFGGMAGIVMASLFRSGIKTPVAALATFYRLMGTLSEWGIDGAIAIAIAFACVYALSRRFERQADAGAVELTKDPEAMITALLKLNLLNLMPLSWGRGTGASLTHPSTLRRVQRIAKKAGISNAQLEQIVAQFSIERLTHAEVAAVAEQHKAGEHYGARTSESTASHKAVRQSENVFFILIGLIVVPPAILEFAVERLHVIGLARNVVLGAGIVLTTAIYFLAVKWLPLRKLARIKAARLNTLEKTGIRIKELESTMVGFAPGAAPRIYLGTYNFDVGTLLLSRDRLVYLGRQLKFSVGRKQVLSIQTGPGTPSWWPQQRIYIRWQDEATGKENIFSFSGQEPCSLSQLDSRMSELYSKLLTWRLRGNPQSLPPELEALPVPTLGEVTCTKPRETLRPKVQLTVLVVAGLAIWGVSSALGIRSGYLWLALAVLRVFEILPYLFYREPKQEKQSTGLIGKPAAATGSL